MVRHQDVVIAVLGAAAGLAGLVLVFLGIVITTFQSYNTEDSATVLPGFRRDAKVTLGSFAFGLVSVGSSTAWLLTRNNQGLYIAAIATFGVQLLLLLVAAGLVTKRVLWS
jgi:uncharacterized membrane protein